MLSLSRVAFVVFALCFANVTNAMDSSAGTLKVDRIMSGLDEPWSLAFLPDGSFLVTERSGRLIYAKAGTSQVVAGLPRLVAQGQGGLMDVVVARDFAQTRTIFLSYARPVGGLVGTALARATLSASGGQLTDVEVLFSMFPPDPASKHFGGRIVEDARGHLFLTIGDRGEGSNAQDRESHAGSIVRINRDGSVPSDNPFVGQTGFRPEIWSFGHRNPQGATLDLSGNLWASEHGARGGDEINKITKGANFGWPVISYGRHYNGSKIGVGTQKDGMEQPNHYWDPSIAPSGMMIYSGKLWPAWRGHHFIGSLKFDYIAKLDPKARFAEEVLQSRETGRVRDVREAPDGAIWFLSVDRGAIYRITPQ